MRCQLRLVAILGLLAIFPSAAIARRRSRIDTPIQNAADAPLEDNLATASGSDVILEKVESPPAPREKEDASKAVSDQQCSSDNISFELVTGYDDNALEIHGLEINFTSFRYMLSSSENILDTVPLLMLTECLEQCRNNESCSSVNYETGLCVFFSSHADKLPGELYYLLCKVGYSRFCYPKQVKLKTCEKCRRKKMKVEAGERS